MLLARSAINTIQFLTHHPRRWGSIAQMPMDERQWVWEVSIKLLEQHTMLQSNPHLKQFAWKAAFVMQWHAFIHVLDTLRADPCIPGADKAWRLVESTYDNNQAMILDTRKPIHFAVATLCLKAFDARTAALLQSSDTCAPTTPGFILLLRRQQDIAATRRGARSTGSCRSRNPIPLGGQTTTGIPFYRVLWSSGSYSRP
jgi:hypothetical protein